MSSSGLTYGPDQVDSYLSRIKLPNTPRPTPENVTSHEGLEYLRRLQKYQMKACPFENLNMHYTKDVVKSLEPGDLYKKFVERKWGGTCTETNTFFGFMLRSMGYQIRPVGARVNAAIHGGESRYNGWNHCVNLVTFNDQKYLVDVGMGPTGSTQPLPLAHMHTASGIGLTTSRLRYDTISEYTDPTCKLWIYEQNNDGKSDFVPTYCFTELEFLPQDYELMKLGSMSRKSWFTFRVVCVRTILEEASDGQEEEVIGVLILSDKILKRRIRGKSEQLAVFKNERERTDALKEWFGIEMMEEERLGIRGTVTDLGDGIAFIV